MLRRITLGTAFCAALSCPVDAAPILHQSHDAVDAIARSHSYAQTLIVDFDEFLFNASEMFRSPSDNRARGVPLLSDALISELTPSGVSPAAVSNSAATVHYIKFAIGASVGDVLKLVKRPLLVPVLDAGAPDDDGPAAAPDGDESSPAPDDQASSVVPDDGALAGTFPVGVDGDFETDDFPMSAGGLTQGAIGYAPVGLTPVPEPASLVLLLTGAALSTFRQRARRRALSQASHH